MLRNIFNKRAELKKDIELVVMAFAVILIAYGYYGFIYVPKASTGMGGGLGCPLGAVSQFGAGGGPCLYSLHALIVGAILVILVLVLVLRKK